MLAAACKKVEIIQVLLAAEADPNSLDEDGRSALHIAIEKKNAAAIDLLQNVTDPAIRLAAELGESLPPPRRPDPSPEAEKLIEQFKALLGSPTLKP